MHRRKCRSAKTGGRFLTLKAFVLATLMLLGSAEVYALPRDGSVVGGSSTISQPNATTMHVNQTSNKSIINWQGYSIGGSEKVQYFQPGGGSISLNRVTGVDPSQIHGQLKANGQVWVINPNGLLVGDGARVNVGSFLGSTLNIGNEDFMNGKYDFKTNPSFKGGGEGGILNKGDITAQQGGYVVLVSRAVTNEGTIRSELGKSYLASGDEVTLNFAGDDLIGFTIDKGVAEQILASSSDAEGQGGILNKGKITAHGGEVIISAKAAGDLLKTVINNEGIIEARTIEDKNGVIKLLGGMESNRIEVGGTLDASAPDGGDGGFIETSAAKVSIADGTLITTHAPNGQSGTYLIDPTDFIIAPSGGDMTGAQISNALDLNTTVEISTWPERPGDVGGDIFVNDTITWSSSNSGLIFMSYRNIYVNADITARGDSAGIILNPGAGVSGLIFNNGAVITLSGSPAGLVICGQWWTVINDVNALQNMSADLAGKYALGSDIDASGITDFAPVGNFEEKFTGFFNGLGHTISGLTIDRPSEHSVGLFGATSGADIRYVGLVGGSVSGRDYVGGLVGWNDDDATITNSYNTGSVSGRWNVGGLVGFNYGAIRNSYATDNVSGEGYVGGLVGWNYPESTISTSYATGNVNGNYIVGGLVGWNDFTNAAVIEDIRQAPISNSYATGNVTGDYDLGGLVGLNYGTISNSYATGNVTGDWDTGGLVGANMTTGKISNSYASGDVTGDFDTGPCVGLRMGSSDGCTGLTDAQMMQQASFSGWDFTNIWAIDEGASYPYLLAFVESSTPPTPPGPAPVPGPTPKSTTAPDIVKEEVARVNREGLDAGSEIDGFEPIVSELTEYKEEGTITEALLKKYKYRSWAKIKKLPDGIKEIHIMIPQPPGREDDKVPNTVTIQEYPDGTNIITTRNYRTDVLIKEVKRDGVLLFSVEKKYSERNNFDMDMAGRVFAPDSDPGTKSADSKDQQLSEEESGARELKGIVILGPPDKLTPLKKPSQPVEE